ncbi:MAG: uridine kinase [Candidatus Poribacteria bacterium]|nr:uridine kinase [Candidatus Poribacteria bacterium]
MNISTGLTPIFIGFGGGSGSGKTTLVAAIYERLGKDQSATLSLDRYYRDLSHLNLDNRAQVNFDHPDALDTDLLAQQMRQLKAGQAVEMPTYSFTTHTRLPDTQTLFPNAIVLVEGILLLALDTIRPLLDLKVFIDTPADIRFIRRLMRDINQRGRTLDSVIQQYRATTRPMHFAWVEPSKVFADVVVSGEEDIETLTTLLLQHIENLVNPRLM